MKKIVLLFVMMLLLTTNASGLEAEPKYTGEITPITTPTHFSYGSCKLSCDFELVMSAGEEESNIYMTMNFESLKLPVGVFWNVVIEEMFLNGEVIPLAKPIMTMTMMTTFKGALISGDMEAPGRIMNEAEKSEAMKSLRSMNAVFSSAPIVTGEALYEVLFGNLGFSGENEGSLAMNLAGYSTYQGRKVVVTTCKIEDQLIMFDDQTQAVMNGCGYSLFDAENMMTVDAESYITLMFDEDPQPMSFYMRMTRK